MNFKNCSFRDYLHKPLIIFSDTVLENLQELNKQNSGENILEEETFCYEEGNAILAYGCIDNDTGINFIPLAICKYNENKINLFNIHYSKLTAFSKGFFNDSSFIFPPDDLDLKSYEDIIYMIDDRYSYGEDIENVRRNEKIDTFRHEDHPDDIMVFLAKVKDKIENEDFLRKYDIERVWIRTEKIKTEGIIQGTLRSEPVNDFGIYVKGSLVDVHIGNEVCYIDTKIPLDIANFFQLLYEQIEKFKREENYEDAFLYYYELKNVGNLLNDRKMFLEAIFNQSLICFQSRLYDDALKIMDEADLTYVNEDNALTISLKGQILIQKEETLEEALEIFEKIANFCKTPERVLGFVDALSNQAIVYMKLGDFKETLNIYEKIDEILPNDNIDDEMYLDILRNKSIFFREFEKYEESLETLKKIENIAKDINNMDFLKDSLFMQNGIFVYKIKYQNALKFFESSEKLYDKNDKIETQLSRDFKKVFNLFIKKNFPECIKANEKLINSAKNSSNDLYLAYSLAFEYFLLKYIFPVKYASYKNESLKISNKNGFKEVLVFLDEIE